MLHSLVILLTLQAPAAKASNGCHFDPATLVPERDVVAPRKVKNVPPVFPEEAKEAGKSGTVVIDLLLSAEGKPQQATVKKSIDPMLDEAALAAVRQWEYTPSQIKGRACPTLITVSVNFVLDPPMDKQDSRIDTAPPPSFARSQCGIDLAMPQPRQYETHVLHHPGGDVAVHQYRILVGDMTYGLVCAQAGEIAKGDTRAYLNTMQESILQSNEAAIVSEQPAQLGKHAGREILARAKEYAIRSRLFIFGDRTLNISVIGAEASLATPEVKAFLDSASLVDMGG